MRHFGISIGNFTQPGVGDAQLFERVAAAALAAEAAGLDSLWVMDHFYQIGAIGPRTNSMLEGYTLLGGLAARTSRLSLGTLVSGVTYRNPALLAKMVTTLDIVSGGRAMLGIGAAWNADEHRGYGFEFPPLRERFERLEEAVQICRAMFTEERPSFKGGHYSINRALNFPRPLRPGGPPIMIGGSGEKKTLRLVARYADMSNVMGDLATVRRKLAVLERHCQAEDRDSATIVKTRLAPVAFGRWSGPGWSGRQVMSGAIEAVAEQVQAYLEAGLDGLIFVGDMLDGETIGRLGEALKLVR